MNSRTDRIAGALFGVACGDALGGPLEFMSKQEIRTKYGKVTDMIGGGWLSLQPGEITDDTQMTIAVASGIAEQPDNPVPKVGEHFFKWVEDGPKDIGATCRMSINYAGQYWEWASETQKKTGIAWWNASQETARMNGNRSGGNGALMRTIYPGLYYEDPEKAADIAEQISRMTHWDDTSATICRLYTKMVHSLIENRDLPVKERWEAAEELLAGTPYKEFKCWHELRPTGYVVDSFECALWALRTTQTAREAIVEAVNLGGDADTIGAITGGLAGALYGCRGVPMEWKLELGKDVIKTLIGLAVAATGSRYRNGTKN